MSLEILNLAFKKAEKEIGSNKKTHLAQHLSDVLQDDYNYTISERTLRDYYTKIHKREVGPQDDLKPKLIEPLCQYLGFANYAEFLKSTEEEKSVDVVVSTPIKKKPNKKWLVALLIFLCIGLAIIFLIAERKPDTKDSETIISANCMTWADSTYVKVSCDKGPYSKYGTKVIPYVESEFKNLKKIQVYLAYNFFNDKGEPLVWYFRNEDKVYEFFSYPGLHPVSGKTLKAVTPYIVQKHVPLHNNHVDSFVE